MNTLKSLITNILIQNKLKKADVETIPYFGMDGKETIGRIVNIIDGDTIVVVFSFKTELYKFKIRMAGINCPELHPKTGTEQEKQDEIQSAKNAREYLIRIITGNDSLYGLTPNELKKYFATNSLFVHIKVLGWDKYGRTLAKLYDKNKLCINDMMIKAGHAKPYMV